MFLLIIRSRKISKLYLKHMINLKYRGLGALVINIYSKGKYPANKLSNFAPNSFDFNGFTNIPCMESFLQSLKFEDAREQQRVLYMNAKEAKTVGSAQKWKKFLFWNGKKFNRFSKEYFSLIENAYNSLLMNPNFRQDSLIREEIFFFILSVRH